jgi:hypothetical protein
VEVAETGTVAVVTKTVNIKYESKQRKEENHHEQKE